MLELALIFLRLGATAFGGPLAHIALMRSEFVDKRGWLSNQEFLDLSGAVNLIPGPNSTELAMHIGYKRGGLRGVFVAGACFILPAMILVLILAAIYQTYGALPATREILRAVSPVVVAIIAQAGWKFAPVGLKNRLSQIVGILAFVAITVGANEVAIIFGAAALGLILARRRKGFVDETSTRNSVDETKHPGALWVLAAPISLAPFWSIFLTFAKMGAFVYGSGYVLIAYLRAELVENLGWISNGQLLDAVAIGQITPGPVFTSATFLGFQIGGLQGAIAATAGIFAPGFFLVALGASSMSRWMKLPGARTFLDCVNAASFALMLRVTLELSFATFAPANRLDVFALTLGIVSFVLLIWTRINSAYLLLASAVVGFLIQIVPSFWR